MRILGRINKLTHYLLAVFVLGSCTFTPKVAEQQDYASACDMTTKALTLDKEVFAMTSCGSDAKAIPACLLAYAIGIPALSLVVSGSIVVAGNTIHWLEYQGKCDSID